MRSFVLVSRERNGVFEVGVRADRDSGGSVYIAILDGEESGGNGTAGSACIDDGIKAKLLSYEAEV